MTGTRNIRITCLVDPDLDREINASMVKPSFSIIGFRHFRAHHTSGTSSTSFRNSFSIGHFTYC